MKWTVKAAAANEDVWELDVLGVPYGGPLNGRDTDGEFFTPETRFHEDKYPSPAVVYYHGYDPESGKPAGSPVYIGKTLGREAKPDGVWYRVALDKSSELARRVWEAAKSGIARASSGSSHLSRVAPDGRILEWPVIELSIFDAVGRRQPANAYAVAIPAIKAVYEAAGLPWPLDIEASEASAEGPAGHRATEPASPQTVHKTSQGGSTMNREEILAILSEAKKAEAEERAAAEAAQAAEEARIKSAVEAERSKWEAAAAEGRRLPYGEMGQAPAVAKFGNLRKYDNLEPGDAAFAVGLLMAAKSRAMSEHGASSDFVKALAVKLAEDTTEANESARRAMKAQGLPLKANELNQSTLSTYGDEWVGVAYSNTLWEKIRMATPVAALVPTIEVPDGVESIIMPLESTAPTFYKVAQASATDSSTLGKVTYTIPASKMATGQRQLTLAKVGGRVAFSSELEEDSVIPWAAELRRSLEREAAEVMEHLIIDGDTATGATTNINTIGGTPAGTEAYLAIDGLRKLALVTNTANSRDCGASLSVESYLETLKLMGLGGSYSANRNDSVFVVDMATYWATLKLAEVKSQDVWAAPTIESGMLAGLWGRRLIASPNMHRANQDATYGLKANSSGKVDLTTASNNTFGSILAFTPSQWRMGWKRRIRFETERIPQADATDVIVTMRFGLAYRDNEASAITYDVPLS